MFVPQRIIFEKDALNYEIGKNNQIITFVKML